MEMIFKNNIFNEFLKKTRKKYKLTIPDLSFNTNLSTGTISNLENNEIIDFQSEKLKKILTYYHLDTDYLYALNVSIKDLLDNFINNIIYINDEDVNKYYSLLTNNLNQYEDTDFYLLYYFVKLLYFVYTDQINLITKNILEYISINKEILGNDYLSLCNLYLAQYYYDIHDFENTKIYYNIIKKSIIYNHIDYNDMINYCLARYSIGLNNHTDAYKYLDLSLTGFAKHSNFNRLINTNILLANHSLKLHNYKECIEINLNNLNLIDKNSHLYEQNEILFNIGYTYTFLNDFQSTLYYYDQIRLNEFNEKKYFHYMLALFENNHLEQAHTLCDYLTNKVTNPYYIQLVKSFSNYFINNDYNKLTRSLALIPKKYNLSLYQQDFLLNILIIHYKKLNQYKKAFIYMEKRFYLSTN